MQAIDYVIRDGQGRLSRGEINGNSEKLVLSVDQFTHVSLNLSRDDVHSYRRAGDQLIIEMEDGREIILDGMFEGDGGLNTRLYFSENGTIHEITFSEAWGRTNYAHFDEASGLNGMVFADAGAAAVMVTTPEVTMAAAPLFLGGIGLGGAGAVAAGVAGAAVIGAGLGGGGGSGSDAAAAAVDTNLTNFGGAITSNGSGANNLANGAEVNAGLTVTGYTFPNTSVNVTIGSTTLTTMSDADGNYTVVFNPADLMQGEYATAVTATVVDANGVTLVASSPFDVDTITNVGINNTTVEGDGVILASETADGIAVTGTSQPSSNVVVTFGGQNLSATSDASGNWSVTFPGGITAGINDQMVAITAQATDLAGNTATTTQNVQIDTVLDVAINGNQTGDDIINRGEAASGVTFTGTTNPGAFVSVVFNGVTESATVAADGSWTVDFAASAVPGANTTVTMVANASDALGNATSSSHDIYVDHEGMVAIDTALVEIDDIVNLNEQADGVTITGTTTPGSTVVVHFHTFTGNATVSANGSWTVDVPAANIDLGTYNANVSATATTGNGNVSTATDTVQIDTEVMNLAHNGLVSGDGFINATEQGNGVSLSGTVEPGSTVTVEMDNTVKTAVVDANGNWTVTFTSFDVDAGDYQTTMTATAIDIAGNTQTISQTVQVDTVGGNLNLSSVPIEGDNTVNSTEASDGLEIDGQADPGVTVTVTLGGVTHTTVADANGNWTVFFTTPEIDSNDGVTPLVVQTSDVAGNVTTVNSTCDLRP